MIKIPGVPPGVEVIGLGVKAGELFLNADGPGQFFVASAPSHYWSMLHVKPADGYEFKPRGERSIIFDIVKKKKKKKQKYVTIKFKAPDDISNRPDLGVLYCNTDGYRLYENAITYTVTEE